MSISSPEVTRVRAAQSADWALSRGKASLTTSEVADLLGVPVSQVPQRLMVPKQRGEWIAPARGLWVPVPPEFRGWNGSPAVEFISALMAHLNVSYYVGWLAAAATYGATHQAAQVTNIATSRLVRDRTIGRADLHFHTRDNITRLPTRQLMSRSGAYLVSTPEVTALDLATDLTLAGGLDNAATVIVDLANEVGLTDETLVSLGDLYPDASIRRVGWIIEEHTDYRLDVVARRVADGSQSPARLHPRLALSGALDSRWKLRLNTGVEVE
ncbi:MAG: type IV toxin-antitoxin system AbiEi family antitoxin [Propionibacteriaceae bacterium]|nr:type IV toxin-antitoxin system AbiEi family antitoxin [Propionibacteriaceae bacterium]